jgi:hypothetical protein
MIQDFYYLWLTFLLSFFPQLAQFYFSRYKLVNFQKNMPEILLRQLQAKEQAIQKNIKNQFRKIKKEN